MSGVLTMNIDILSNKSKNCTAWSEYNIQYCIHYVVQARLEDGGDDLSRPVQDAQNQLGRLKDLMTSMFR